MPSLLTLAISAGAAAPVAAAKAPSAEEMWQIIQEQRELIKRQNQKIDQLSSQYEKLNNQTEQNTQAVAATAEAVENAASTGNAINDWVNRSRFGGYGELHYNNLDANHSDTGSDKDELDLHRFVLFFSHEFTDDIRLFSELEVEHALAGEGKDGEVEMEQMYIDFDLNEQATARAGVFLLPVGILNETHEPNTYYGTERNPIEKNIIPTTWWEGGAGLHGQFAPGWSYDVYLHSGLETSAGDKYAPRKGRQKTSEALAKDWAGTARIKWTGIPGLELAASAQYQDDITQSQDDDAGSATLLSAHAVYENGPFGLRALYARWDLDGDGPDSVGADKQDGFYVEPSWRINDKFGVFARYNEWDNQAGDSDGSEKEQIDVGINYWPHEDVVVKADYMTQDFDDEKGQKGFNLGIGYQF
jgi:hypothetical protein